MREAIAHERVPLSRGKAGWIIKREFRVGVSYSQCVLMLDGAIHRRLLRTARAIARIGQGVLSLVPSLFLGRAALIRSLSLCARGVGGILGIMNYRYLEYNDIH